MTTTNRPSVGQRVWLYSDSLLHPIRSGTVLAVDKDDDPHFNAPYVTVARDCGDFKPKPEKYAWGWRCFTTEHEAALAAIKGCHCTLSELIDILHKSERANSSAGSGSLAGMVEYIAHNKGEQQ